MKHKILYLTIITSTIFSACTKDDMMPIDPATAERVEVDRFSETAGNLFVRDDANGLPMPNTAIDFDMAPFITQGLGPGGEVVRYYNFDVMPKASAPIWVLFKEGETSPVEGQLNIIDVLPGDEGYSDFWHVHKVTVPDNYVANVVTSYLEIAAAGYPIEQTTTIVNCPVVPDGSTASLRYNADEPKGLINGWYRGKVVSYFTFAEKTLVVDLPAEGHPDVPLSDILVTFNINPDMEGGGPPSGFVTEMNSSQTHNVVETLPEDTDYSPFWDVDVYDNADFSNVSDWTSAMNANLLGSSVALVNCPIVEVE